MDDTFRSPSSVSLKVSNLLGANPHVPGGMRDSKREIALVERFLQNREQMLADAVALRARLQADNVAPAKSTDRWDEEELRVATEGGPAYVLTLRRERSRTLRLSKISAVEEAGLPIECEVCRFDFFRIYGELGRSYIEVHHRTPLHVSGEVESTLPDLALLCANCHRMIHRRGWMPVEDLNDLINSVGEQASN